MTTVGQRERETQARVVAWFREKLGYRYLGNWGDRAGNANIETEILTDWLTRQGHDPKITDRTLFELNKAAALGGSRSLYTANQEVYGLLRYGVKVSPEQGEHRQWP